MRTHSDNPERFAAGATVLVGPDASRARACRISASRPHRGGLLVGFEDVSDRDRAEELRGSLVFVPASALGRPEEGSFWEHELVGLEVVDVSGRPLGSIAGVYGRAEQDLWEVVAEGSTVLMPAVEQIVLRVDLEERKVVVDPPAGLFPETEA